MRARLGTTGPEADGSGSGCRAAGGKLFLTVFFLFFFGMGALFVVLITREFVREMAVYFWDHTPCTVLESGVEETDDDENPYRLTVTYRYSYGGGDFTSSRVALNPQGSGNYDTIQREALTNYPPGATVTCRVNPDRPAEAVLHRRSPAFGLLVLFPMIFVLIGAGGIYAVWRPEKPEAESTSISREGLIRRRAWLLPIVLGTIFAVVGGALFVFIGVLPALRLIRASGWIETECTIVSSTIRSHTSDEGTTYKVDILYEYEAGGNRYRSNRYDFVDFSSSGYSGKRVIVDSHPAGSTAVCYVDPDDPTRAVLNRQFRASYLVGLLPLIFLLAGVGVLTWGLRQHRKARGRTDGVPTLATSHADAGHGAAVLEPEATPASKLLGALFFCLIWNGIVSVFIWQLASGWAQGDRDWFLLVFLLPFVLVGLGAVVFVAYTALALVNPRPVLTLSSATVPLGGEVDIGWQFRGRVERLRRLEIFVEGREEASVSHGDSTKIRREAFMRITAVDTDQPIGMARGSTRVTIPDDTMHSFELGGTKVVWSLKVKGDVPNWPDVDEEFAFVVLPAAENEGRR
jgi:hypothetical protein